MFEQYHRLHGISHTDPLTKKHSDHPLVIFQAPGKELFAVAPQQLITLYKAAATMHPDTPKPYGLLFTLEKGLRDAWKTSGNETNVDWDKTLEIILKTGFEILVETPAEAPRQIPATPLQRLAL